MTRDATGASGQRPARRADGGAALRRTPFYDRQAELDAAFYDSDGWAGVYWYESNAELAEAYDVPTGVDESPAIGVEHLATREHGGMYDLSPSTPVEIRGPGAGDHVQRLFTNDMRMDVGRSRYACMLDEAGGILADLVVTRLDEETYLAMTAYGPPGDRHADWMRSHAPAGVEVINRDSAYASVGIWGPAVAAAVEPLTDADLSRDAIPYFANRRIELAGLPVTVIRVSYVGEHGWEFWTPTEYGTQLWDALWSAAAERGVVGMGDGAIMSLAAEKGYRIWGMEVTEDHDPYGARLEHTVDLDTDFIGKAALEAVLDDGGPDELLTCITVDDPTVRPAIGAEVLANGEAVAEVLRSDYGYTVGRAIVYAHVPREHSEPGTSLAVTTDDGPVDATAREEPLYDPDDSRMRG